MVDNFQFLEWDSNFFKVKTGRINSSLEPEELPTLLEELARKGIELIYYNAPNALPENIHYEANLLDRRVTLIKKLKEKKVWDPHVKFYEKEFFDKKLFDLAKRVAQSSRFFYDPNIPQEMVYKMYELWLKKSLKKEMASQILVYEKDSEILGFATIKIIDKEKAYIPMLAVDSANEGKGISFSLMRAIETFLINNNCNYLFSETHAKNLKAIKIYERFGISCEQSHYVYHLWKRKR